MTPEFLMAVGAGMVAGSYLTGFIAVLFACTSEPWPDRAGIALVWPLAVGLNVWRG